MNIYYIIDTLNDNTLKLDITATEVSLSDYNNDVIAVGFGGKTYLVEIVNGCTCSSCKGTDQTQSVFANWNGAKFTARDLRSLIDGLFNNQDAVSKIISLPLFSYAFGYLDGNNTQENYDQE